MITVRSFDVFDTCLIRKLAAPSDVFYETADKVFAKIEIRSNASLVENFVAARCNAERSARHQSPREDITLEEIWRNLVRSMGWQYDQSLADCELEAEAEALVPIFSTCEEVRAARRRGSRILFVSDMYLPAEFVMQQLRRHGFAESGDGCYVSSEIGKTKASGNLFRHVMAQERVPASRIMHIGDNEHSDCTVPRKLGISVGIFEESRMTDAEMSMLRIAGPPRAAGRLAGAMRSYRLERDAEESNVNELVSQFVGPFIAGFTAWVLGRAREDGVKRLYFLSRDCQLIWRVAREVAPQFGGIDCRYLHVSRQSLSLPSSEAVSPGEMPWMERGFENAVLDRLLAKVELKYEDVESAFGAVARGKRGEYQLKSPHDWELFWTTLNHESIKKRILHSIDTRREAVKMYFESQGMFDEVSWAVVDLGWLLSCQRSLYRLFKLWGRHEPMRGYYLGLNNWRFGCAETGIADAMIYDRLPDFPAKPRTPTVFSHSTLLEHVIGCADHPTVHHYEMDNGRTVHPVFSGKVGEEALTVCRNLRDAVLDFVRKNPRIVDDFSNTADCRSILESLFATFTMFPTNRAAASLRALSAGTDQNNLDTRPIVRPLNFGDALLSLVPKRGPFGLWKCNDGIFWREGSMATTPVAVRRFSSLVHPVATLRRAARRRIFRP